MALLEHHDELGLPWDELADGQTHVLTRGVDFFRSPDALMEAATNAGHRLNRAVNVYKEHRLGRTYVWVQFPEYEVILGEPCACGSLELQLLTPRLAECAACGATVILRQPKRRVGGDEEASGTGPADALLQPLFATGFGGARSGSVKGIPPLSRDARRELFQQSKEGVAKEEARSWSRQGFNEHGAIVATGVFSEDKLLSGALDVNQEAEICALVELGSKRIHSWCGIVLTTRERQGYRLLQDESVLIYRPGRFTFKVKIPPMTLAPGEYSARTVVAIVKDEQFSRITRRLAFTLDVRDPDAGAGGSVVEHEAAAEPGVTLLDQLEWSVEEGEGPWASLTDTADDG
jgi:hypothetical protein